MKLVTLRRVPPAGPDLVILVIILVFTAVMTALGCDPAAAVTSAGGAAAIAYGTRGSSGPR